MASVFNIQRNGIGQSVPLDGRYAGVFDPRQAYPGVAVPFYFEINDVAGDHDKDIPSDIDHSFRVIDIKAYKRGGAGGAGDTVQVKNGATAISDAASLNVADKKLVSFTDLDDGDSAGFLEPGDTLRVTITDGNAGATDLSCAVIVWCIPID